MVHSENAIEVTDVKKYFKVYYDRGVTLKDRLLSHGRNRYEKRQVLDGISFSVKKGEAIGLIGKNGCGKSTTLKLQTRIIYPNEGRIELNGRVSSLLELGAGFHPDMSGRENIYMNAAVFGLNKREIDNRLNDIIHFSELEEFIDNPIRTYSSGMYMRLAFSVAINVDADILLIDEILAVGDINYQKKCFEKLKEIKMNGSTIVIVSHSLDQIEKICDRTIWIADGKIHEEGRPRDVHIHYLYSMEQTRLEQFQEEHYQDLELDASEETAKGPNPTEKGSSEPASPTENSGTTSEANAAPEENTDEPPKEHIPSIAEKIKPLKHNFLSGSNKKRLRSGDGKIYFTEMYITDTNNEEKLFFETGSDIHVYLRYKTAVKDARGTLCLLIYRDDGVYCFGSNTFLEKLEVMELAQTQYLEIDLLRIPLLPGKYTMTIAIHDEQAINNDIVENIAAFQTFSTKGDLGVTRISSEWRLE